MVVAIIAILASLLLPALQRAREAALSTACLSNLKQNYSGFTLYANDHDGRMAAYARISASGGKSAAEYGWARFLSGVGSAGAYFIAEAGKRGAEYIPVQQGVRGVLGCPAGVALVRDNNENTDLANTVNQTYGTSSLKRYYTIDTGVLTKALQGVKATRVVATSTFSTDWPQLVTANLTSPPSPRRGTTKTGTLTATSEYLLADSYRWGGASSGKNQHYRVSHEESGGAVVIGGTSTNDNVYTLQWTHSGGVNTLYYAGHASMAGLETLKESGVTLVANRERTMFIGLP